MRVPWPEKHEWQRVLVYGLGRSGVAAARLLHGRGVAVAAVDAKPENALQLGQLSGIEDIDLMLGREPDRLPSGVDGVVVSPGVPADRPLLADARARGVPVISEIELASWFVDGTVVGITGSNGKSTTTALAGHLLTGAGFNVVVCGNIGVPLSACVAGEKGRTFVVELSSFQLENVETLRPKVAALLNVSADHLDRHRDLGAYVASKASVFARQSLDDFAVLNADDPIVRKVAVQARRRLFSRRETVTDGCFLDGETVFEVAPGEPPRELFHRRDLQLTGLHNLENAMAAALVARCLGASAASFGADLGAFEGLPHRLQRVAEIDGVAWLDDSKGTNVAATLRSLESFSGTSVHLILGGRDKGADLSQLVDAAARTVRRIYLIGETTAVFEQVFAGRVPTERCGNLERAVLSAARYAEAGDSVLLSPACASFDQYRDYVERGEHFRTLVQRLAEESRG